MQENRLNVSASPHILSNASARKIMLGVVVALVPTLVAATVIFGWRVLLLVGVTVAACVGFEALFCIVTKRPQPIGDLSAVVTGMLLAFNLPPGFPLWMAIIGAFVSIVLVKQLFGGIGFNFANPAIVGRLVLQVSFTGSMISYTFPETGVDALASATPLLAMENGSVPIIDLLLGTHGGALGETCAITLILGGLFLIFTRIISPIIPVVYLGGAFLFKFALLLFGGETMPAVGDAALSSLLYLLSGGLLLGAFFMATDYTTSPYTRSGKLVFALFLAVITVSIREWSNMNEGVSFAILLGNLLVPYINELFRQRPLGVRRKHTKATKKGVA